VRASESSLSNENRLATYYLKVLQLYFKLVDKLEGNLQYSSIVNFKGMLVKKLAETDEKFGVSGNSLRVEVNFRAYDALGNETNINEQIARTEEAARGKFSITGAAADHYLLVVQVRVCDIASNDGASLLGDIVVGDSFMLSAGVAVNLTQRVKYFDSFSFKLSGDSDAGHASVQHVLGPQAHGAHFDADVHAPLTDKIQAFGVDSGRTDAQVSWHERGLWLCSAKLGDFIVRFDDVEAVRYVSEPQANLLELRLREPLVLKKYTQPVVVLAFKGKSVSDHFYSLVRAFEAMDKPVEKVSDESFRAGGSKRVKADQSEKIAQALARMDDANRAQLGDVALTNNAAASNELAMTDAPSDKLELILTIGYLTSREALLRSLAEHVERQGAKAFAALTTDVFAVKYVDLGAFVADTLSKLNAIDASGRTTVVAVDVPYCVSYVAVAQALIARGFKVHKVVAVLDGKLCVQSAFSGPAVEPYLNDALVDKIIVNVRGLHGDEFDYVYKLQNCVSANKVVQTKDNRVDLRTLSDILAFRSTSKAGVTSAHVFASHCYYVDWRVPLNKAHTQSALQLLFEERDGVLLRGHQARHAAVGLASDDVANELVALQQRVGVIKQYFAGEGVLVHSINGIVRFEDEPSKVYKLTAVKGVLELEELASGLEHTQEEYKDLLLAKPVYADKALQAKFGVFIDFTGNLDAEALKAAFAANFVIVSLQAARSSARSQGDRADGRAGQGDRARAQGRGAGRGRQVRRVPLARLQRQAVRPPPQLANKIESCSWASISAASPSATRSSGERSMREWRF